MPNRRTGRVVASLACALLVTQAGASMRAQPPQPAQPAPPAAGAPPAPVDPREAAADAALTEGRRLFDAAEYERAVALFDQAVINFDALSRTSPHAKDGLLEAYELRGRAQFSLNKAADARSNFETLLRRSPTYALSDQVSPRVLKLFDDVRNAVTGRVVLMVSTPDADVKVDGEPLVALSEPITLAEGAHTVTAVRPGYAPLTLPFNVAAGPTTAEVPVTLERISALLAINTMPAGVVVSLNGVVRGTTEPGGDAAPGDASSSGMRPGPAGSSKTLVLSDLPVGTHTLEFTRDCYVPIQRRINITQLADLREPVVTLKPAVASVEVAVKGAGATVFLDDTPRGAAPMTLPNVCEGTHTLEVRSSYGRYVRRITVKTDDKVTLEGEVKPAFGLVSLLGHAQVRGGVDPRSVVERVLADDGSVMMYAPAADRTEQASKLEQLPPGWLAFDRTGRAVGQGAASIAAPARIEISTQLSRALEVQGVAGIAVTSPDGDEMLLSLLASGAAEPDVLAFKVSDAESMSAVRRALATVFQLYRHSAGLLAIDVLDIPGATVAQVEPGGAAAAAGIVPGEVITSANGRPVRSVADLEAALAALPEDRQLSFGVRAPAGGMRKVELVAALVPRALVMSDQTLLANKAILDLRRRLPAAMNTRDEPVVRLNLAIALMHARSWALARAELERVTLPSQGPGISNGTVQYLLGLCYDALGLPNDAARAWKVAAADTTGLLTEDGPPIADMAASRLAALERGRR
jgi:hypothetical protein